VYQSGDVGSAASQAQAQVQPRLSRTGSAQNEGPTGTSVDSEPGAAGGKKAGGKDMFHKMKLMVKGGAAAKVVKSDDSLAAANEALKIISRQLASIENIVKTNDTAFNMLADSHRMFAATVSTIYVDTDPVLGVTTETNTASDAVKAITVPNSATDILRREVQSTLAELNARVNRLSELHKFRESQTKEHLYFTSKFSSLEDNAIKRVGSGSTANEKETERLVRNETKLREVTSVLNSVTEQFYNDLESLYKDRALFVDKFVRYFILLQSELLVPFHKIPNTVNLSAIGIRPVPGTLEPPKRPPPVAVHVSFVPTDNPQLVSNVGYPEGAVTYPGHAGHASIPFPDMNQASYNYSSAFDVQGRIVSPPPVGGGTEYTVTSAPDPQLSHNPHVAPPRPSHAAFVVPPPGHGAPPGDQWGPAPSAPPITSSVWGAYADTTSNPGDLSTMPSAVKNYQNPSLAQADTNTAPPAPAPPPPVSDAYVPIPPPHPSFVRNG
jgi:hypothetical protein